MHRVLLTERTFGTIALLYPQLSISMLEFVAVALVLIISLVYLMYVLLRRPAEAKDCDKKPKRLPGPLCIPNVCPISFPRTPAIYSISTEI